MSQEQGQSPVSPSGVVQARARAQEARFVRRFLIGASLVLGAIVVGAYALATGLGSSTSATATSVAVVLKDFAVVGASASAPAGLVDFTVANEGPAAHEFLVFATDLAPDQLPLGEDGRVDEAADGATKVFDSVTNIDVGSSKTFHTALTPGNYVLICNLPAHYKNGMRTAFTVTA